MGFFFCPRFRWYRKASGSSDLLSSYQLDRIESSSSLHGPPEGISLSTVAQTRYERESSSSGGLSGRFRRRLSQDTRDWHGRPKRPERGPRSPFFNFASRHPAVHPAPAAYDLGSSLMSEKGYDSDAQYITTPKHQVHSAELPTGRPRNGMAMSPRRQPPPYRELEMNHSREQTFGLVVDNRAMANEQPPYHGEVGVSQMSQRSRDHEHRSPQVFQESPSSFHNVDIGSPRGRALSPSSSVTRAWAQERSAPVPTVRVQELHRPHIPVALGRPPMPGGFDDTIGQRSVHGYDTGVSGHPGHHVLQQEAFTTSAESLNGCPSQLSVRKRHQRPRRDMTPDEHSVHLAEMNIQRMLASSSSTSHLLPQNHPLDENQSSTNPGTWNVNRYQGLNNPATMSPIWDAPEPKLVPQPIRIQDSRSPYSPKNSVSSAGYRYDEQKFPENGQDSFGNLPLKRSHLPPSQPGYTWQPAEARNSNPDNTSAPESYAAVASNALKSKSTEKIGSGRSAGPEGLASSIEDDVGSPRKISIGWMSEGRRVGYGYTLVPPENTNEEHKQIYCGPGLPENCDSVRVNPNGTFTENIAEHPDRQRLQQTGKTSKSTPKISESSFDISAILHRLNLPRWTGESFPLGTSITSDAGSCDSGASSLFRNLIKQKKNHEEAGTDADTNNPWEFCSWVRPTQSSGAQKAPQQDIIGSRTNAEAQVVEKLATLRRRGGAWAIKRKVSETARNFERRAVAKLASSTEQFPLVQRTATRVLRLRGPGSREQPGRMHDNTPASSMNQFDGDSDRRSFNVRPAERTSSGSSEDWDSLYEECLEER